MKHSQKHSSIFLLELMISILFFALVSASCLKVFAKARNLSIETYNLNHGISQLENVAELLKSIDPSEISNADTVTEVLESFYDKSVEADKEGDATWWIYFNNNWQACNVYDTAFVVELQKEETEGSSSLCSYSITVKEIIKDESIEELTLKLHTS